MEKFFKRLLGKPGERERGAPPNKPGRSAPGRFANDRSRMFDLEQTRVLNAQLHVPPADREENWGEAFFPAAWFGSIHLPENGLVESPDGFRYIRLDIPAAGPFESNCLANLADYALDNGFGAAFFLSPDAESPSALISLGQLYSMMHYDSWTGDPQDVAERRRGPPERGIDVEHDPAGGQRLTFRESHEILLGAPSRDYLPWQLAAGLHRHLTALFGLKDPMVGLLVDPLLAPSRNLLLDCNDALARAQIQKLLWYLPPARSMMLLPDGWSRENMVPLASYVERGSSS